jgi:hypothetical protein
MRSSGTAAKSTSASAKVGAVLGPPPWDFRKYGLFSEEELRDALKLKRENRGAFKSSIRAQELVAYCERRVRWEISLAKAAEENIPQPLRDLGTATDRKCKPKQRFAALQRFKRSFGKIPMNVAIALFKWLEGGPKSDLQNALDRKVVTLKVNPKTGHLAEVDGRGQKIAPATIRRVKFVARLHNDGLSQRKIAPKLFPNLSVDQAYVRTRDFFFNYRYLIELSAYRLRRRPQPSGKSRR